MSFDSPCGWASFDLLTMQRPLSTLSCFLGFLTFLDGLRCVVGVSWRGSWISAVFGSHHYLSALLGIALSPMCPLLDFGPPSYVQSSVKLFCLFLVVGC